MNGKSIKPESAHFTAIIDSGTSAIIGPSDIIKEILAQSPPNFKCENTLNMPLVSFIIEGIEYTLKGEEYMLKKASGLNECEMGFQGTQLPSQFSGTFILGDSFMKNFYTHFDLGRRKIGFAKAKHNLK